MNRRRFLGLLGGGLAGLCLPWPALAAPGDLRVWLVRDGDEDQLAFWQQGRLDVAAYNRACYLLRDPHVDPYFGVRQIDTNLLAALARIQGWLGQFGVNRPLVIHSGYRTPQTNARLENAARRSFHLRGQAADFHMPDIPLDYLYKLVRLTPGVGGVGYYPRAQGGWVHVDTGPNRVWRG